VTVIVFPCKPEIVIAIPSSQAPLITNQIIVLPSLIRKHRMLSAIQS
jgi:hypothetical protein